MSDRYVYIRKNGEPSRAVSLTTVMVAERLRLVPGTVDRWRFRKNERPAGPPRSRSDILKRTHTVLPHYQVGDRLRVYAEDQEGVLFAVHKVQPTMVVIDISGNHNADVYYSTIMELYPQYKPRYAGSYVCKDVAGTSTPSQHSYGNAVDFFFDSLAHQDAVAAWVVANADSLNVHTVISRDRIWTRADGWHAYTGDYHSHLHVDFDPQFSGACGVREP